MRILHFTLGLPPYRSGGLTKYATDLMLKQHACGEIVSLLYAGDYTFWKLPKMQIVKDKAFGGISVYEIKNPPPVPLLYGVRKPSDITRRRQQLSESSLNQFYNEVKPEVIHLHTLMGLPAELIIFLKSKDVKIVFTSHDYYGLCLKVNFINQEGVICGSPGGELCAICNKQSPSSLFLKLRNSKYLLKYKAVLSSKTISSKEIKAGIDKNKTNLKLQPIQKRKEEYIILLNEYRKLFDLVDCFHFNSTVSKEVYEKFITPKQSFVLPISHADIKDTRKLKKIDNNHIRLAFIGSTTMYKGFPLLKDVLLQINKNGQSNWTMQVWGDFIGSDSESDKISYKGKYLAENLESIFDNLDLLIVPSIWKETFSLITLEALSFGLPTLVSSNVGAKDVIKEYNPDFIFHPTFEALSSKLQAILSNPSLIVDFNREILTNKFEYFLDYHVKKVKQLYINLL